MGDRGYLSSEKQLNLFESCQIKLEVSMQKNQHNHMQQLYIFGKCRKRIETFFSQLCDQFMIQRNYPKSFEGYKTRILSKITAATLVLYIKKLSLTGISIILKPALFKMLNGIIYKKRESLPAIPLKTITLVKQNRNWKDQPNRRTYAQVSRIS
ncbi:transposase [Flavobacterium sp. RNTU_13]|uniref:transposase n=1 Tax=Flavobacterium sp. RNTU_13 TaxID=3375145 RepID=UPI0039868AE9